MTRKQPPDNARLLSRLRLVAAVVLIVAVGIIPISEAFELPFKNPDFHTDPTVFGIMVGALLLLLGIETVVKLPWFQAGGPSKKSDEDDDDQ